ncbi:hypothetical protein RJT34_26570 [Clitoria ternatea]|uniref:TIR domain-containing protein n=1 Tax=Clitoria ternatea TaxID=43366 RepID=A0AAN9IBM7_CLITE
MMASRVAASSSCSTGKWTYDVFLSFRGKDTRRDFTSTLYNSLQRKGFHTFLDDKRLRKGEEITPALLNAIQESRIAIIVLSEDYASSTYCLDELVHILECFMAKQQLLVYPVFYEVDPTHVRHQKGSYSTAFAKHEERFEGDKDKLQKWRKALYQAANLSGWHFHHGSPPQVEFIEEIVREVSKTLNHIPLHVAENPVGLEYAVQEVMSLLGNKSDANMIGIYGMGGLGKTTLARALYNLISAQFEGSCFLPDIREKAIHKDIGLVQLQEKLLSEILQENDIKVGDVNRGIPLIQRRLQHKRILLILDDVDELEQLKALAGGNDWFGSKSLVIITTRDKHLLATHGVQKLYKVKPLNDENALELFSWHAFKNKRVDPHFVDVSKRAVSYACGIPLALEVIGSHLFGKSLKECGSALDKYATIPHKKIHKILKVSYESLEEEEKGIFLDIACFFNTSEVNYVNQMLHAHGFHAEDGMRVLVDRCLIKIDCYGFVRMHDLIRDMGREIVREESTSHPGQRSRLWFDEEVVDVLEENTGTDKIEIIKLKACNSIKVQWNGKAFKKMKNLKILIIENAIFSTGPEHLPNSLRVLDWSGYPLRSLPSDFNPKQVEILHMPCSCLETFQPHKMLKSLSIINFDECNFLSELPSLEELPFLANLCLDNCINLVKIHHSVGFLDNLCSLSAKGCTKLKNLAPCIKLTSLEILDLRRCSSLESFPEVLEKMEKIREVYLDETSIEKLPFSIGNLVGLQLLSLKQCRVRQLPGSLSTLRKVEVLFGYGHQGYTFYVGNQDEEKMSSEVSQEVMLFCDEGMYTTFPDVYYPYTSPDNVIQVCRPHQLMHPHFMNSLFKKERRRFGWNHPVRNLSVHFSFRKKFPKIALCCFLTPIIKRVMILMFKFTVLINGTKQLSSSCNYISSTWDPMFWCDLKCKSETEGIFLDREWNEVEIMLEMTYPKPSSGEGFELPFGESLSGALIGVYEEGNTKKNVKFKNPMSTFPFSNGKSLFTKIKNGKSLLHCLYYVTGG